jgi:hypothetical protein
MYLLYQAARACGVDGEGAFGAGKCGNEKVNTNAPTPDTGHLAPFFGLFFFFTQLVNFSLSGVVLTYLPHSLFRMQPLQIRLGQFLNNGCGGRQRLTAV